MAEVIINNVSYTTEDRIRKCAKCDDWYYNAPSLVNFIELSKTQKELFDATLLGFAWCPTCNIVEVWEGIDREFID